MKEINRDLAAVVIVTLVVGLALGGLAFWGESVACNDKWKDFGEPKYSFVSGCLIKIDRKWVPEKAIKEVTIYKEFK